MGSGITVFKGVTTPSTTTPPPIVFNRTAMANNNNLPLTFSTSANWVHNCWTMHKAAGSGTWNSIQVTFSNWLLITNGEEAGFYDFVLNAGLFYKGVFYPFTFGGLSTVTISKNFGNAISDSLTIPGGIAAGDTFYVTNRRVASDGGVAGSYNVLTNTAGILARQDGVLAGTNSAIDYTLGVGAAYGATVTPLTSSNVSGGVIQNNLTVATPGTNNYTSGPNMRAWYGAAGVNQPGSQYAGTSAMTGFGNRTSGHISSVTVSSGGAGHNSSAPPPVFLGGGGGFGSATTQSYGPTLITGIPSVKVPSVLSVGDSIDAGFTSVDTTGDLVANFGYYEQAFQNTVGFHKFAVVGQTITAWTTNNTHQLALLDSWISGGLVLDYAHIALGVNDFLTNTTSGVLNTVNTHTATAATALRNRAAKIILSTVPPNNSSTDGFITVVNQTPTNVNFQSGSFVDQFNTALRNNTGPAYDALIDGRATMQDSVTTTAWRTDAFQGSWGSATAFTTDGTHPNIGCGIPYLRANVVLPTLT